MLRAVTHAETRTLGYGIAGSLALHVLIFCVLAFWMGLEPVQKMIKLEPVVEPAVTMISPENVVEEPAKPVEPEQKKDRSFIRTSQNESKTDAPKNASFISDRNTAASAKVVSEGGTAPMPTTQGIKTPTMELANREYKEGELKNDSAPVPPPMQQPAPPQPKPPKIAKKESAPAEKMMKELDEKIEMREGAEHLPIDVRKPHDKNALPEPTPAMKTPEDEPLPKAIPVAPPPAPVTPRPEKNAYVPQTRTSEVKGTIRNQGVEDAVDAMETAEGKYMAEIQKRVGEKWHRYLAMTRNRDLSKPGVFAVTFVVNMDGSVHPEDISVRSDMGNVAIESIAVKAIREAKLPPIPTDLLRQLDRGRFSTGINFLINLP